MTGRAVCLSTLLAALAGTASAQLIQIRTVPIAQGDQFAIFPSNNLGMGSVSIALADSLLDPFVNPAKGGRLGAARLFGSPTVYSVSQDAGGGRTLPLAAIAGSGSWYGGLALALQEVDPSRPVASGFVGVLDTDLPVALVRNTAGLAPTVQSHGNQYAFAMVGKVLPRQRLSLGASTLWAGLHALDGVDLLYAGSRRIVQRGHALDLRVGVLKEWAGGPSLEAIVLHHRFAMRHDVTYADLIWDPGTQQVVERPRLERNRDHTNTWGVHAEYERPLGPSGWRFGWLATVNRLSHPKLPNYELASLPAIPRDPGRSAAYNLGVGLSKTRGPATFGIDAVYEPIRSYTWADAAAPVVTAAGDTIPAGGKTIENRFRFSNAVFRMGFARDVELHRLGRAVGLQLGLVVRSVRYRLNQFDNVQITGRRLAQGWTEWTPTWGLSLRFPELEVRYRGRATHGAGRPGVQGFPVLATRDLALGGGSILAAPTGSLSLTGVTTATHQISFSLPLR